MINARAYTLDPQAPWAEAVVVRDGIIVFVGETAASWREELKGEHYHYNTLKIPDDGTVEGRTAAIEVITDQDVPRFGELGVTAQNTPLWASYDTYGEQFVSADQFSRWNLGG